MEIREIERPPALRRPKMEVVKAAEAEVAAARAARASTETDDAAAAGPPGGSKLGPRSVPEGQDDEDECWQLRCSSLAAEEVAAEMGRRRKGASVPANKDYPGLAFGAPLGFGSDTMMKFNIIKNELHNIMRSQLKRVDGEVASLHGRLKDLDVHLQKSEHYIRQATTALSEAVQLQQVSENASCPEHGGAGSCPPGCHSAYTDGADEEDPLGQFDRQMAALEERLFHAKLLANQHNQEQLQYQQRQQTQGQSLQQSTAGSVAPEGDVKGCDNDVEMTPEEVSMPLEAVSMPLEEVSMP